ncbi:hypothetical protein AB6A40_004509 [Gnathostoma spinigerum]|uniref:AGC-kinase C-terminal domain-containing protein n=1 Tax=Gnathostoma spinigerum TaxID=75299 RepID=A0ABD6EDU2_9BILA
MHDLPYAVIHLLHDSDDSGDNRSERGVPAPNVMVTSEPLSTSSSGAAKDLVDLEEIVLNWAKQMFEVTKTKSEARINKKHLQYNINWSHLLNESLEPQYSPNGHIPTGVDKNNVKSLKDEKVLFKSTFTNTTDREQEYSFKTERTTRSSATVSVEKGLCRGMEMSLKLKTPCEVVEANAGFHNEVSVYHIGENTTEEELTWGVDSNVRVPPLCETVAQLVILEERHTRKFSIENHLSGRIIVTVTNLRDNNSLVTIIEGRISDIIRGSTNYTKRGFTVNNDIVSFTTKGTCTFKYGVEQNVKITEHPIRRY